MSSLGSFAAVNSWLKSGSGKWEEAQSWSLGLPNSGHAVMITNAGWKAVEIAPSTVQSVPNSLTVYSITVASPVDSRNTLLLNYAGFDRPLTVNYSLTVGSGSAMDIFSSALRLAGPTGVGLSIGGEFNQNDSSQVTGNQADVGWAGPGVYNLNSGLLGLQHLWVGGPNNGVFNQNGGSNSPGIVHFESGGTYNLRDGDFNGTTYTSENTVFRQDGGRVHSLLEFHRGRYILNNGVNYGGVKIPVYGNFQKGNASAVQNGGTMFGPVYVGGEADGGGSYTISNGVILAPVISVDMFSDFHQLGGSVTSTQAINVTFGFFDRGSVGPASYRLSAGLLSSPGIHIDLSSFHQDGGTNQVAGDLGLVGTWYGTTSYSLNSGLLVTENTVLAGAPQGGFFQSGGIHRVANVLGFLGNSTTFYGGWKGYEMNGGQLIISNVSMSPGSLFRQTGGTVTQSGTMTVNASYLFVGPGTQQFGALQISSTNSLTMPTNASSIVRFRNSSALPWDANASLIIDNYSGSYLGGGTQQIIFGNNSSALTTQQVAKIFFRNPADLAFGLHPAKILPSGEIVPDSVPPTGHNPSRLAVRKLPDSTVQITVTADPGFNYGVLTSTDLATWNLWTNGVATNGTFSVIDPTPVDTWPNRRSYKAVLMR